MTARGVTNTVIKTIIWIIIRIGNDQLIKVACHGTRCLCCLTTACFTMHFTLGELAKIIEPVGNRWPFITGGDVKIGILGRIGRCHGFRFNHGKHCLAITDGFLRLLKKRRD